MSRKANMIELDLLRLQRRADELKAGKRGYNNAHIDRKIDDLRVDYRRLHAKWMAVKSQMEMDV